MHDCHIDTLTLRAADAVSRRRSLLALGGAAVASAAVGPSLSRAGKDAKKARKRKKKKCRRQIDQCRTFFLELCGAPGADCEEEELDGFLASCDLLQNCKAGESVDRFFETVFDGSTARRIRPRHVVARRDR